MNKGRRSKLCHLADALGTVRSGQTIALGGLWFHNRPCAAVRELIRSGIRDLVLMAAPPSSYDVDLLIGAGAVKQAYLAHVSFEHLGLAPRFRAAVERGEIDLVECDESTLLGGFMATVEGLTHHPITSLRGTDHLRSSPLAVQDSTLSGTAPVAAPALRPDVALIHAQSADIYGNVRHAGAPFCDPLLAKVADTVIVTVDEIIDNEDVRADPRKTTIPGYLVDAVVHVAYGAHPCSSHGGYAHDERHLMEYLTAARSSDDDDSAYARYLAQFVYEPADHDDYLRRVGGTTHIEALAGEVA